MSEIEKPKKRKRKNEERRARGWLLLMAFLLLLMLPAGLFVYVSVQPEPTPTFVFPTATPVFMLNHHCDVTGNNYQVTLTQPTAQHILSPDKQYVVELRDTGIFLSKTTPNAEAIQLFPRFINTYYYAVYWSSDSRFFTTRNDEAQLILVDTDGNQRILLDYAQDMLGWSPDNRHVLANDGSNIWLIPVEGEARILTEFDPMSYYIQNWSPNGEYIVMIGNDTNDYSTKKLSVLPTDPQRPVVIKDVRVFNQYVEWSPDGKNVVLFTKSDDETLGVRLMALDGSAVQVYGIPAGMTLAPTPVIWSQDNRKIALHLRPETAPLPLSIVLMGLDGMLQPITEQGMNTYYTMGSGSMRHLDLTDMQWSEDDQEFRYWEHDILYAYHRPTQTRRELYRLSAGADDLRSIRYVAALDRMVIQTPRQDGTGVDVVAPVGELIAHYDLPIINEQQDAGLWSPTEEAVILLNDNRVNPHVVSIVGSFALPLLPDAFADMGQPSWSPQGHFVAITWSDIADIPGQFNPERRVYLTLMDIRTGEITTISDDFHSVYNLVWTDDEHTLIYTAWRETGTTIERLDLQTGEFQQIADGERTYNIQYEAGRQYITLWREVNVKKGIGDWRYEAYTLAGDAVFNFALPDTKIGWTKFFASDDGMTMVVKAVGEGYENQGVMVLDVATGSTHIIMTHLKGLGDPVWSPDGKLIMFTQWTQEQVLSVRVIDRTGKPIWSQELDRLYKLEWQKCE